uniref:Uncharacterized protein n=1 Tax=Anguilla anguilla TaxID=7936 RepID=A0A0E9QLW2_ANGAN
MYFRLFNAKNGNVYIQYDLLEVIYHGWWSLWQRYLNLFF